MILSTFEKRLINYLVPARTNVDVSLQEPALFAPVSIPVKQAIVIIAPFYLTSYWWRHRSFSEAKLIACL